jgi:4-hydroxybenzoate polyprenyltransferase
MMVKSLQKPLDFLLFSNIFISFGAAAQGLVTYHLLNKPINLSIILFLFFSTILTYNFSILIQKPKNPQQSAFKRVRWIFSHYKLNVGFTLVSALSLLFIFIKLSFQVQILAAVLGVLSIGYALPIFSINGKKLGLRNIPGLKLFLIALVWALSAVLIPILELQQTHQLEISNENTSILIIKRFLFIVAITIPFDIRDMFQDKVYGLKTIATVFGERKAFLACQFMLGSYLILLFLFNKDGFSNDFFALATTILLSGWLIFKSKWKKNEHYYFLYLDGILILQYIMLLLFKFVF